MDVIVICTDVVLRGAVRTGPPLPRRLSDLLNQQDNDLEVEDARALTGTAAVRDLLGEGSHAPAAMVRRSRILAVVPLEENGQPARSWDTYIEKAPSPVSLLVGDDLAVRGNVWHAAVADVSMMLRTASHHFIPVTEAEIAGRQIDACRAAGAGALADAAASCPVVIVNGAAIGMWRPAEPIPVAVERLTPPAAREVDLQGIAARRMDMIRR